MTHPTRSHRPVSAPFRCLVLAAAMLLVGPGLTSIAWGQGRSVVETGRTEADWSRRVWADALQRDAEGVLSTLSHLAQRDTTRESPVLRPAATTFIEHLEAQTAERRETYEESMRKLEEHLAEDNLRDALVDALAAHEASLEPQELLALLPDTGLRYKDELLEKPVVRELLHRAEQTARQAEQDGDWLMAQDLFYRLNEFRDREHDEDVERIMRRLAVLRFYAPKRLDELMNRHLVRLGEEPRPSYEDDLDSWSKRLAGVRRAMVLDTVQVVATNHLAQVGYPVLLAGGFEALETLVTTTDLVEVFPGIANESARRKFLDHVREQQAHWLNEQRGDRLRTGRALDRLEDVNRQTIGLPASVLYHEFADGAISRLGRETGDQFSDLIWPYEMDLFKRQLDGTFSGVGIQIVIESNQLRVVTPLDGSPAHRAGIQAGDDIIAVDGRPTLGITINQAIDQITGPRGTTVELTVRRSGEVDPLKYTLRRAEIDIESVKGWRRSEERGWDYWIDRPRGIGYLRLTGFLRQTVDDFDAAINEMGNDLKGLVIDLRFNPGGQLQAVVELCNRFISRGVLVSTEGPGVAGRSHRAFPHRTNRRLAELPVVVLVNQGSASASEILAGALRDHERAIVVGTRTYGKGSVQKIVDSIDNGNAWLRLTSEHYVLPGGDRIHRDRQSAQWGVDPHLIVRMTPKQIAESLKIMRDADILPDPTRPWTDEQRAERNPRRLLDEALDTQLETAMVLLRARVGGSDRAHALGDP